MIPQSLIVGLGDFEPQIAVYHGFSGVLRIGRNSKGLEFGSPSDLNQMPGDIFAGIDIIVVDLELPVVARSMVVAFVVWTLVLVVFCRGILDLYGKCI